MDRNMKHHAAAFKFKTRIKDLEAALRNCPGFSVAEHY
jgi:hypothetical protein